MAGDSGARGSAGSGPGSAVTDSSIGGPPPPGAAAAELAPPGGATPGLAAPTGTAAMLPVVVLASIARNVCPPAARRA